jgi:uncharacterized coiled-coil protein SlyX
MTNYPILKNKVAYLFTLLSIAALTIVPFKVYADENSPTENEQNTTEHESENQKPNEIDDEKENRPILLNRLKENEQEDGKEGNDIKQGNRCELRKLKINGKLKMYGLSEKFHREKFQRLHERLSDLIVKLDAKGIDTSKLKDDLAVLKTKLDQLETQYAALIDKLNALKDQTCDTTTTETNKAQIAEIKSLFENLKQTAGEIRSFFSNTIRPDLRDLKQKLEALKETEEHDSTISGTTEPTENDD